MDSKMKFYLALCAILMGMTNFYGYIRLGIDGVEGQGATTPCVYPYCNRTLAQVQAAGPGGDGCAGAKCPGTYKSVLSCYNMNNKLIYRYDYYTCRKSGPSCVLYRFNCSGALSPVINKDGTTSSIVTWLGAAALGLHLQPHLVHLQTTLRQLLLPHQQ